MEKLVSVALWLAFAMAMGFATKLFGWAGLACIVAAGALLAVYFRVKDGYWSL